MKILILMIFCTCLYSAELYELECRQDLLLLSEKTALNEAGISEEPGNRGCVTKYLDAVRLREGNPYCAAAQYWAFAKAAELLGIDKNDIPFPRTGLANAVFNHFKNKGIKQRFVPRRHSFIIWRRGKTVFGHIERIIKVGKAGWVHTIAFNVKFNKNGITYEGAAVKRRNIYHPLGRMNIRGIAALKGVRDEF